MNKNLLIKICMFTVCLSTFNSCSLVKDYEYKRILSYYDDLSKKIDKANTLNEISILIQDLNKKDIHLNKNFSYTYDERISVENKKLETIQKMQYKFNKIISRSNLNAECNKKDSILCIF